MKKYFSKGLEYVKEDWSIDEVPPEFDATIQIDIFIEDLKKAIAQLLDEGKDKKILAHILEVQIVAIESRKLNPLLKNVRATNEYFLARLNEVKLLCFEVDPVPPPTKAEILKEQLSQYGFFELLKVKQLSDPNKQQLFESISTNDLPYNIAMFDYLEFIKHLRSEYFTSDYKLFIAVANWFQVDERAVKGNIYVLKAKSKENRGRYTADQQKQKVQKDYEALK